MAKKTSAASSLPERLAKKSESDIRRYVKSAEFKRDAARVREHLRRHGGEPSPEDLTEIPELTEEELNSARPAKQQLTIRLDTDIVEWLKSKRGAYQTRLNNILRIVMMRERSAAAKSRERYSR